MLKLLDELLGRSVDEANRDWRDLTDLTEFDVSGEKCLLVCQESGNLRFLHFFARQSQNSCLLHKGHDERVVEVLA